MNKLPAYQPTSLPAYQPTSLKFGTVNINDLKPNVLYQWDGKQPSFRADMDACQFRIAESNMVDTVIKDEYVSLYATTPDSNHIGNLSVFIPKDKNGDMHGLDVVA